LLAVAALECSSALSQVAPTAPDAQQPLEEVVVTGSRIPIPTNAPPISPIQTISSEDITLSGQTDVVDVLNLLPQTTIDEGVDFGNHSNPLSVPGGISTADLRGLGPQRTLVLVDGRRLGLGDPNTSNFAPAPDIDQIPTPLIERVEIVTGGASATYGSDAVAGVVNFILKRDFQGIQVDAQYGLAQHDQHNSDAEAQERDAGITPPTGSITDGDKRDASLIAGTAFADGAGNVTGYFVYHDQEAVPGSARDFSACQAFDNNALSGVPTQPGFFCHGSSDSNKFVTVEGNAYSVVGNQFLPYPVPGSVPPPRFNFAPYEYEQRQDTRYQAGLFAHLDVDRTFKPYLEFSYMDDRTLEQIAPSGLFQGENPFTSDGGYLVNCSNPLLSAQEAATICTPAQIAQDRADPGSVSADLDIGRRNIEGGGRESRYEHANYRLVGGAGGEFADAWSYDAYVLYYYTNLFQSNLNYLNFNAIDNALQAYRTPSGQIACVSGGSCVPYDIFSTGAVTQQQLNYLYTTGTDEGDNSLVTLHADFTGRLGTYGLASPWAHTDFAVNLGAEHRTEALRFAPDAAELSGELAGYSGSLVAIDERYEVNEGFIEARMPILQDRPAASDLTLISGYRYSSYSTVGGASTYKFGVQYAPLPDVGFRYSYDRVVRAPNLIELYTPQSYAESTLVTSDPCAPTNGGVTHAQASLAACEHTGVTAAEYGNGFGPAVGGTSTIPQCAADACGQLVGGNPHLAPETADTWSVGATFTPTFVPGWTTSIDYYHIALSGEIGIVPDGIILAQCLSTANPFYCGQIVRGPQGQLSGNPTSTSGFILQTLINTGTAVVSGIDVQSSYGWRLPGNWGRITADLIGAWLQHKTFSPYPGAQGYDCAGLFGNICFNGSVNPIWRHNLRVTWQTVANLSLSAQWRFIGRSDFENNSSQPLLQGQDEGFVDPLLTHVPNYSYLDLAVLWTVSHSVELRAGVNNLFDKDPPFLPAADVSGTAGDFNTFPVYDLLGREIFAGFRVTFR
jgi:iron complex outermembrane recepter protein